MSGRPARRAGGPRGLQGPFRAPLPRGWPARAVLFWMHDGRFARARFVGARTDRPGAAPLPPPWRGRWAAYVRGEDENPARWPASPPGGGPFSRRARDACRAIGRGRVATYEALARRAGSPRAARAAGRAMATNPLPLVVPCHRVVPASGGTGRYGPGERLKRLLLALEGATDFR